jgi:cytochrome c
MARRRVLALALPMLLWVVSPAQAQLRGHGGPVRAIAVSSDGMRAISGSFDTTAIRWSLSSSTAEKVLRFHEGAVNCAVFLNDGRVATSGEDTRIAIWRPGDDKPMAVLQGHSAPVVGLAASPDGKLLASAAWDHTARLWPLAGGEPRVLEGHQQNVNGVAFAPDGRAVITAGYDLTLRIWPIAGSGAPTIATLPTPLNAVVIAPDGDIVTAGANGKVYFLAPSGDVKGEVEAAAVPIIAVALAGDGKLVAASSIKGSIAIIERAGRTLERTLVGPGLPAWSAAFLPDNGTLLTGGTDRLVRRWNAHTGEHIGEVAMSGPADSLAAYEGDPGACWPLRPPHCDPARLQLLGGPEEAGHRVDARDRLEVVRGGPRRLHARHQDARAARRRRGPRSPGQVPGEGDQQPVTKSIR